MDAFKSDVLKLKDKGHKVRIAVKYTDNIRCFCNQLESLGVGIFIVNNLNFKVINESVNKIDKRYASVIAEFLSKDMLCIFRFYLDSFNKFHLSSF